jgi:uncharacterized protein (TIGR02145 family)
MKKNYLTLVFAMVFSWLIAQPPAFKYQTLVRDAGGTLIANQAVAFRISILKDNVSGTAVYTEDHSATTNNFGLANLEIGNGTPVLGTFGGIDLGAGDHYLKISLDITGGDVFVLMGTSQLLSVPYALVSGRANALTLTDPNGNRYDITIDSEGNLIGFSCGTSTVTDTDGNVYNTVLIGSQCWMKENLKTTTYSNGTPVPNVTDATAWSNLTTAGYVWYDNDMNWKDKYGALYNWYATVNPNGLCPIGWHVPSHNEWTALTTLIGGTSSPYGNKLKSCRQVNSLLGGDCNTTVHPRWEYFSASIYGTDEYGFSSLPGGYRFIDGSFGNVGYFGHWWSTTEASWGSAWGRTLGYGYGYVAVGSYNKPNGFSVRCLRD